MPSEKSYYRNVNHWRAKSKKYYYENRDRILKRQKEERKTTEWKVSHKKAFKKHRDLKIREVNKIKNIPCSDCKKKFPPYCMDFDHVRGKKEFTISNRVCCSRKVLLKEIAKCDVVCAICHRIRTYMRAQEKRSVRSI